MNQSNTTLEGILTKAVEIASPGERQVYLGKACAGNSALRAKVDRLIANHFRAGSFLEHPVAVLETAALPVQVEVAGTQIGPYKLIEQIGEGGMGVVYVAEQQHPVRRTVALKLIKPGMDSKQVIARFEAERQALALMDHPNIAKVLDAGTTEAGRPYFVMELVRGIPITEYCDQARFTIRQRLEVFVQVCRAVQHAHTKGVIHRDLKPSNVLVTSHDGIPVPLVIDFGVAKALGNELTEQTLHTGFTQMIGTPLYMSPEQAEFNQKGVDTRSDIYSLGVLLYELLAGVIPFDGVRLLSVDFAEFRRIMREEEPPRPSDQLSTLGASLSTVSERRGVDPRKLPQMLHGELDWIVMKCLDKDRTRRYETASAFAADVQRYLNDEAVEACPPSVGYRMRKFARRHKGGMAVAAGVLTFVLVVTGILGWVIRDRAARQDESERRAEDALKNAEAFLEQENWPEGLRAVEQAESFLESSTAETAILNRAHQLSRELKMAQRLEEVRLQGGNVENEHFDWEESNLAYMAVFKDYGLEIDTLDPQMAAAVIVARPIRRQLTAALENWASFRTEGWKQRLAVARAANPDPWRNRLCDALETGGRRSLEELLAAAPVRDWPVSTLLLLGEMAMRTPSDQVTALLLQEQQRHPGDFWINDVLAKNLHNSRPPRLEEAIRFQMVAVALRPQSPGAHNNLGNLLHEKRQVDRAIAEYREALRLKKDYAMPHYNLGMIMNEKGHLDQAITEYRAALRLNNEYAPAHNNLGMALHDKGRVDEAIAEYREALRLNKDYALAHNNLGSALEDKGRVDDAIAEYREALRLNNDHAPAHYNLGIIMNNKGQVDQAITEFRTAIRLKKDFAEALCNLGLALNSQGQFAEALSNLHRGHELGSKKQRWPYPSAQWVKECERFIELEAKLPAILSGKERPTNAEEWAEYAAFFQTKRMYVAATQFYREAITAQSVLVSSSVSNHRYNAACAAALASDGAGQDAAQLTNVERAKLRNQAFDWLRTELTKQSQLLENGQAKDRVILEKTLKHWLQDADLAAVRDESSLARLPMDEKQAWIKFWAEVQETLRKAQDQPTTQKKSP
jgi:serine/threonine protein kinase/Flp pilus assembly protein TadD